MSAADAIAALEAQGWRRAATGDWSWVLISPGGDLAARVSPWDAAYLLHAQLCRRLANPHLQRIEAILPLGALGHVVVMERLWPAPEDRAAAFCAALKLPGDSGWTAPADLDLAAFEADPHLTQLRQAVLALAKQGEALPFWGGLDVRPGNVMAGASGVLKLVDPVFVAGRRIVAAIEERDRTALARLPAGALAAFLSIPVFQSGADGLWAAVGEMGLV